MSNCSPPFLKLSTNSLGWNYSSIYPKERYRLPSVELASTKDKETNNKGSLPWKSSEPRRGFGGDAAHGKSRAGSGFLLLHAASEDWLVLRRGVRAGFPFTNSTLAATETMNQSLLPHAFCQNGPFLSCRSPNFTYRQGFQAKPSSRGPPPRRVPWSQEDAPPLRSLPGAKGLTMLSVTPSLRATKSVITDSSQSPCTRCLHELQGLTAAD